MKIRPARVFGRAALALGVVLAIGAAAPAAQASTRCSSAFAVEHHDRVGSLLLPRGAYQVRAAGGLSCARASSYFAAFLDDFDGILPQGWRYKVRGRGQGLFTQRGSTAAFAVTRQSSRGGGGGRPVTTLTCRGSFSVLHDDAVGALPIAAGRYRPTRLGALSPSCGRIRRLFQTFLDDPDGILPGDWIVLPQDGTFVNGTVHYGFRIEPLG